MNCHEKNKESNETHKHSHSKHMLHMLLCCALPIGIIVLLPFISRFSPSLSRLLAVIAPFICPLMMISMIPMMMGRNKNKGCYKDGSNNESSVNYQK